jgi:hypothetical protein
MIDNESYDTQDCHILVGLSPMFENSVLNVNFHIFVADYEWNELYQFKFLYEFSEDIIYNGNLPPFPSMQDYDMICEILSLNNRNRYCCFMGSNGSDEFCSFDKILIVNRFKESIQNWINQIFRTTEKLNHESILLLKQMFFPSVEKLKVCELVLSMNKTKNNIEKQNFNNQKQELHNVC